MAATFVFNPENPTLVKKEEYCQTNCLMCAKANDRRICIFRPSASSQTNGNNRRPSKTHNNAPRKHNSTLFHHYSFAGTKFPLRFVLLAFYLFSGCSIPFMTHLQRAARSCHGISNRLEHKAHKTLRTAFLRLIYQVLSSVQLNWGGGGAACSPHHLHISCFTTTNFLSHTIARFDLLIESYVTRNINWVWWQDVN